MLQKFTSDAPYKHVMVAESYSKARLVLWNKTVRTDQICKPKQTGLIHWFLAYPKV